MANIDIVAPGASATALRNALALQGAGAIAQSAVAQSVTGTTTETTLATITIPAGSMGPNGQIEVTTLWSCTNSANNKTLRVKFGSTAFLNVAATTSAAIHVLTRIANRNSAASQVGSPSSTTNSLGATGASVTTAAIDTTADVTLAITGQLASASETLTLESYIVKIYPKA
jgi:hypothetical protein